jgi:hypothetical protein
MLMARTGRLALVAAVPFVSCLLGCSQSGERRTSASSPTPVRETAFVRLIARHEGDFGPQVSRWQLAINGDGGAMLTFYPSARPGRAFDLTSAQMERIRHVLSEVAFCELPKEIGRGVPSGGLRSIDLLLRDGRRCRSTLGFPPNIKNDERVAAARFLDAWLVVRETFSDAAAFDGREYLLPYRERWRKPLDQQGAN